jgi:hypothetical protein
MRRSRTVLASILWLLISIAMAVSAQAGQKKDSADKRPSVGRGDIRSYRGRGWRGRGYGRGYGRGGGRGYWGRVYEEKPFGFCPPPCLRK